MEQIQKGAIKSKSALRKELITFGSVIVSTTLVTTLPTGFARAQEIALEEIVVTSRKREESLLDIPVAVTAITAVDIEQRGIKDMSGIADFTPGLNFEGLQVVRNDRRQNVFIVRGVSPDGPAAHRNTTEAFLDGAAIANGAVAGLTDIERVEIIKGPQSAYFGRSTFAGAINYITKTPSNEWNGRVTAEGGRFDSVEFTAAIEGPVVEDKLAFRLAGRFYDTDGQYINAANPTQKLGERTTKSLSATLYATPSDNFTAKAYFTLWKDDDGPGAQVVFNPVPPAFNCNPGVLQWICGEVPKPTADQIAQNTVVIPFVQENLIENGADFNLIFDPPFNEDFGFERHAWHSNLTLDYTIPNADVTITSNTAYHQDHNDSLTDQDSRDSSNLPNFLAAFIPNANPLNDWPFIIEDSHEDFSQEIRVASGTDQRFQWLVGANYFDQEVVLGVSTLSPFGFLQFNDNTTRTVETIGVFGSAAYDITDELTLSVEGRWQSDKVTARLTPTAPILEETFKNFSPRVILDYKPDTETTLYATFARGYRPGEFNPEVASLSPADQAIVVQQSGAGIAAPEEKLDNYEVGYKATVFDGRAIINSSVYYMEWKNRHLTTLVLLPDPANPTGLNIFAVRSAQGLVELWGIELEGSAQITENLNFSGTFNVSDTSIKRDSCSICGQISGNADDAIGNRLPRTSKYSGSVSATYGDSLVGDFDWYVRGDYIYNGNRFATPLNLARTGSSHRVNARIGTETEDVRIEAYVNNLFDNETYPGLMSQINLLNFAEQTIGGALPDRRAWGVRATYDF